MISKFKFPINNIIHPRVNLSEVRENMYCIYLIRNTLNNKIYIGKHKYKNSPIDNYSGSGIYLNRAYEKYGIENFEKEILEINISKEEINSKEKEYIREARIQNKHLYNIAEGGDGGITYIGENPHKGWIPSEETRRKMSEADMGRIPWNKGIKYPEELRLKIREATHKYCETRVITEEYREKCRLSHLLSSNNKKEKHYLYGKMWVHDENGNNIAIDKNALIPEGYVKGKIVKRKNIDHKDPKFIEKAMKGKAISEALREVLTLNNILFNLKGKSNQVRLLVEITHGNINLINPFVLNNKIHFNTFKKDIKDLFKVDFESKSSQLDYYYRFCVEHGIYKAQKWSYQNFKNWSEENDKYIRDFIEKNNLNLPLYLQKIDLNKKVLEYSLDEHEIHSIKDYINLLNNNKDVINNSKFEIFKKEKENIPYIDYFSSLKELHPGVFVKKMYDLI